jgi:integrase
MARARPGLRQHGGHAPQRRERAPQFQAICEKAGLGKDWTPRELRHSFVSMLSADGLATEDISHLVGHSSTRTTERVYRHELRPVLRTGAERMSRILGQRS